MEGKDAIKPTLQADPDHQHHHATEAGPPRPLMTHRDALASWFEGLQRHASVPSPEATKAAEWLTDNDYVLRRVIHSVGKDIPTHLYSKLPRLAQPEYFGLPRIWFVARSALDAVEMQPSLGSLSTFISAYQEGQELTI